MGPYLRTVRETDAWTEVVSIGTIQLLCGLHRSVRETLRSEDVIAHEPLTFVQRREIFPTETKIDGQVRTELPVILVKHGVACSAEISLAVEVGTGCRIEAHTFEEAARIIGKIQ